MVTVLSSKRPILEHMKVVKSALSVQFNKESTGSLITLLRKNATPNPTFTSPSITAVGAPGNQLKSKLGEPNSPKSTTMEPLPTTAKHQLTSPLSNQTKKPHPLKKLKEMIKNEMTEFEFIKTHGVGERQLL